MTGYQWATLALGAAGFMITWAGLWFGAGRFVEKIKAAVKKDIETERDKIVDRIEELERQFQDEQRSQDHNVGEMGAALRRHIETVHEKLREVEIWGRDNYLKIDDFEKAVERLSSDFRLAVNEIKTDIRELLKSRQS